MSDPQTHQSAHGKRVRKSLHFYPGEKQLLWVVGGDVEIRAEAWGGENPKPNEVDPVMKPRRTTAGTFIIHTYAPYRTKTWAWSNVRWGTPIKPGPNNTVLYLNLATRVWTTMKDRHGNEFTQDEVLKAHWGNYGKTAFPTTWQLNDFGPFSIRYFKDKNHDGKLDGDEHLSGEMIHTSPENEGQALQGDDKVKLKSSHGCIHVKPRDREFFKQAGAFKRGTKFVIHRYEEVIPPQWR
jgi:hypothetical protein